MRRGCSGGEPHSGRSASRCHDPVVRPRPLRRRAAFDPELAILDVRMPELDGLRAHGQTARPEGPDLDVILMTGSVDDLDEKLVRAIRGEAFYFIQKPFDREVLRTLVDRCLELRWRRDERRRHLPATRNRARRSARVSTGVAPPLASRSSAPPRARAGYSPCSELGGDLGRLCLQVPLEEAALLVADVSGHGASAAMLTGNREECLPIDPCGRLRPLLGRRALRGERVWPRSRSSALSRCLRRSCRRMRPSCDSSMPGTRPGCCGAPAARRWRSAAPAHSSRQRCPLPDGPWSRSRSEKAIASCCTRMACRTR